MSTRQLHTHATALNTNDGLSPLADAAYQLDDNLRRQEGHVFLTGTQALVRLMVMQKLSDVGQGLNTAGFISGYRGSPLGAVDQEVWRGKALLESHGIEFLPAINEDLGATAVLGSQQVGSDPQRKVDGVFAMWYGKGPGVDRAGDAIKHGNAYGSSPLGGVLVVLGDDHGCVSSSMPHQSEQALMAWSMPVLNPANIEEYLEFGLYGWALSRFSGNWVGFKAISETVEGGAVVRLPQKTTYVIPDDYTYPSDGLHYRWPDLPSLALEERLSEKLHAVQAFARRNSIDRLVVAAPGATLGIISAGKAYLDLIEALQRMGLPQQRLEELGVRLYKPGLTYPLERSRLLSFVAGLDEVLVVEEKGAVIEDQLKQILYNLPQASRPQILGKTDAHNQPLLSALGELRPSRIAPALIRWLGPKLPALKLHEQQPKFCAADLLSNAADAVKRTPYFCSGCPHNTSTRVPEGSRGLAGIGCHFMATWMDRSTFNLTQMGGEGAPWVAASRFTNEKHVFQNLGDGTYFHSGSLAIRQAIAARTNITYKILYNDAVAMTGGQPVDGTLTVSQIVQQVSSEGAAKVVVVSDEPEKYAAVPLLTGVTVHHRSELDFIQRQLRETEGVTVLIYDQTCAAEKRRRRKKNKPGNIAFPDPQRRMMINPAVCEGCGDCGVQSNCLSILPLETELGRKRHIEQSSCNKDYSCVEGFCPSFVSVLGGQLRKPAAAKVSLADLEQQLSAYPLPAVWSFDKPFEMLVAGVGGTGVVTVGALITMAAHLEGKGASTLDFMGFAQKGGAVMSHVRIAASPAGLNQVRIDLQQADAILACDLVVAAMTDSLSVMRHGHTQVVANDREIPTAEFTHNPDASVNKAGLFEKIRAAAGDTNVESIDAQDVAAQVLGEPIGANILMMGYAWQKGLVPVSLAAMMRAIELNKVAVDMNKKAFTLGRLAAADAAALSGLVKPSAQVIQFTAPKSLEEMLAFRQDLLTKYQNASYAGRYLEIVRRVEQKEREVDGVESKKTLSKAVARYLYKVMAYKDEYEVARLHSDPVFMEQIAAQFEGDYRLSFHLAAPLVSKKRKGSTLAFKRDFGGWMLSAFKLMAPLKIVRGTPLDIFGYTEERKRERDWRDAYISLIDDICRDLSKDNKAAALKLAQLPEKVRGYGHVKLANLEQVQVEMRLLKRQFNAVGEVMTFKRA
ncbi:indolepyruvate ferredoxin oxidoreductase family protein [Herbaspirillum sp. RTI4]|uniref:indolepyruvate ferredoxin oxidoreductase family protein n=1 Tax=Herbaspirillum sp. RTI4 TaxID=3048640 RepID=UPI002AB38496|nr:indolepyruvate ferredoxin oxidoreductase family protein [Herbaspirillum sp. RTI4]MDY7578114.1 indolepyruvate ferredoxin oxidoreductase family protein [Herbaspirillum sp. RTI4]MEA9980703.1 indolepyruvate ferredoxin oxidoreductase family protein [Herbaspirillum sp. RTI4]